MKKVFAPLIFFALFFFIHSPVVFADPAGTANGSSCNGGLGQMYNGQCLPVNNYASQSSSGSGGINIQAIKTYSDGISSLINTVFVPLLFAIAFLTFIYGVYKYFILGADSDTERAAGRQFVLWGVIGFVVILSVWGLVTVVLSTFGITAGGGPPSYPTL